ncbi:MAG: Ig-like domain-containing protein [Bacteroidetes bacterium]|nr:Ig-like domain-containing protein [Bacteroidota bacterium]
MKRFLHFFAFAIIVIKMLAISGCANIIPPTGGLRDSLPPTLVKATPDNNKLHFNSKTIVFNFDEYIDLREVRKELIQSPVAKSDPTVESKLKVVTVKFKDTLEPNTTYSLNFGKAIRDINEGNILNNFTYVFSTGDHIDSLTFSGRVVLASTGKVDSTLTVMLHRHFDDSAVAKEKPRYIARLDTTGNFKFHYLEPGTYAIYALKDEGGQLKYTSKTQLFAFADSPIVVKENYTPVILYAFMDTAGSKPVKKSTPKAATSKKADKEKEKDKRLVVQLGLSNGSLDLLSDFVLTFPVPIKFFDSSQVRFTDENFKDITQFQYLRDTSNKKITLIYKWVPDTKYHMIAQKEFAEDTTGARLLKTDTITFQTKRESDYGSLRLRFPNIDLKKNPVLLFMQGETIKETFIFGSNKIYYKKLFLPGEYELRILYDDNKNGIWDPGEFYGAHRQPEKVIPIRRKLNVKSNWDNETDITL